MFARRKPDFQEKPARESLFGREWRKIARILNAPMTSGSVFSLATKTTRREEGSLAGSVDGSRR
jgi:hypothetical protein